MEESEDNKKKIKQKIRDEEKELVEDLKKLKESFKDAEKIFEEHPPSLQ